MKYSVFRKYRNAPRPSVPKVLYIRAKDDISKAPDKRVTLLPHVSKCPALQREHRGLVTKEVTLYVQSFNPSFIYSFTHSPTNPTQILAKSSPPLPRAKWNPELLPPTPPFQPIPKSENTNTNTVSGTLYRENVVLKTILVKKNSLLKNTTRRPPLHFPPLIRVRELRVRFLDARDLGGPLAALFGGGEQGDEVGEGARGEEFVGAVVEGTRRLLLLGWRFRGGVGGRGGGCGCGCGCDGDGGRGRDLEDGLEDVDVV